MSTYLKFLSKNKLYAVIEALGLSVALGFVILLASYARTEFSVGARQPLSKQLYAIGTGACIGMTYGTAEEFFPSVPEITSWTRVGAYGDADVIVNDDYYAAEAVCVDTNFLQLFDYTLSGCDKNCILAGKNDVILSEKFAHKAFGRSDPVGRTIKIGKNRFTVTGVIQDFGPYDELQYYDIFLSIRQLDGMVQRMDYFGMVNTFVTLQDGASPDAVAEKLLDKYVDYWKDFYTRDGSGGHFIWGSTLTRLDRLYFSKIDVYSPLRHGDMKIVEVLLAVALILLISAIFNYINLTVAQTGKRAKEMATRRLLGESSGSIVRRYLMESFLFTFVHICLHAGRRAGRPAVQGLDSESSQYRYSSCSGCGYHCGRRHCARAGFGSLRAPSCIYGVEIQAYSCREGRFQVPQQDGVQQGLYRLPEHHKHGSCRCSIDNDSPDAPSGIFAGRVQYRFAVGFLMGARL